MKEIEDMEELTEFIFRVCMIGGMVGATIILAYALFADGTPPPEPDWWLNFETWLLGN